MRTIQELCLDVAAILILCLVVLGCDPSSRRDSVPVTSVLKRSSVTHWHKRTSATNIEVDIPDDLCAFAADHFATVIKLHTVPPTLGDEQKCLLEVTLERKVNREFEEDLSSRHGPVGPARPGQEVIDWMYRRHRTIDRFDSKDYFYYRYDVQCPNTDIIKGSAAVTKVYKQGTSLYEREDDEIVRRILNSAKCLDGKRTP